MKIAPLAPVLLALAVGCSNSQDASESNFKAAIEKELQRESGLKLGGYRKNCIDMDEAGQQDSTGQAGVVLVRVGPFENYKLLALLKSAGLIVEQNKGIGSYNGGYSSFLVKEENIKKYARKGPPTSENKGSSIRFCVGDWAVDQIVSWTVPADVNGKKTSEVKCKIKLANIPDWAKQFAKNNEVIQEEKMKLVLTNQGWLVENPVLDALKGLQ